MERWRGLMTYLRARQSHVQIFTQYREHGAFLWRGYTVQRMADQCFGNNRDTSKGRQMPIHYGAPEHHVVTVSSTVGTQAINAVGAAYAFKVSTLFHVVISARGVLGVTGMPRLGRLP
jgi:TPP-dependent pyruvate/acetoin dehydrogenase alpha subunit